MATHRKAKKDTPPNGNNPNRKFEFKGFVNYDLTDADKQELASLDLEVEFPLEEGLKEVAEDLYKVTIQYDAPNSCYIASLSDLSGFRDSFGFILSGRGSSVERAWASLMYRHLYIFRDGWVLKPTEKLVQDFS